MKNKILTLYVGDNDESLAESAKLADTSAYLIDFDNFDKSHTGIAYTSISDLPGLSEFASLLRQADTIVYAPPMNHQWSDLKRGDSRQRYWTEFYLTACSFNKNKTIINFVPQVPKISNTTIDQRKTDKPQLWVAGCSITFGVGVDDSQRYSDLLASKLDMEFSLLAIPGASIAWNVDQLLRSDIKKGDIVVLGITSSSRYSYYDVDSDLMRYITTTTRDIHIDHAPKIKDIITNKFLIDYNLVYNSINCILQLVNFCKKNNAKLILAGILANLELAIHFKNLDNYIQFDYTYSVNEHDRFLDVGTDNLHPGPEMHKWYAEKIFENLTNRTQS